MRPVLGMLKGYAARVNHWCRLHDLRVNAMHAAHSCYGNRGPARYGQGEALKCQPQTHRLPPLRFNTDIYTNKSFDRQSISRQRRNSNGYCEEGRQGLVVIGHLELGCRP